jgi:hypothetical protein
MEEKAGKEEKVVIPTPTPQEKKTGAPEMPSRVPLPWLSAGKFSLGLHLGFPGLPEETEPSQMFSKRLCNGQRSWIKY